MGWNYIFLSNMISAAGISVIHLTNSDVPWYLTAILLFNIVLSAVSSLAIDMLNKAIGECQAKMNELQACFDNM